MSFTRREFLASLAGLGTLLSVGQASGAPIPDRTFAVSGKLFTGDTTPPADDRTIAVRDGRIELITTRRRLDDRPVIESPGLTIIPGVINAHSHRLHSSTERRERWLEHGVTSIGDVGAPLFAIPLLSDSPAGKTATAAFSGPMLAPPGGYPLPIHSPDHAMVVRSPQEARDAVARLADLGASMIKLSFEPGVMPTPWPLFDPATARAICNTAKRLGLMTRCHVEDFSGLEPALDAGVQVIEHVPHRWMDNGRPRPVVIDSGEVVPEYLRLLERMVRDKIMITPTLDVFTRTPWIGPNLFEPVRAFHAMGGRVVLGNDYPYRRTDAGMPIREMELLATAGLTNEDVIRAATSHAATACRLTDRGVLEAGRKADLLIFADDPFTNLNVMKTPLHIVKDGVFIR